MSLVLNAPCNCDQVKRCPARAAAGFSPHHQRSSQVPPFRTVGSTETTHAGIIRDPKDASRPPGAIGCPAGHLQLHDLEMLVWKGHLISSQHYGRSFLLYWHSLGLRIPLYTGKHAAAFEVNFKLAHVEVKTITYRVRITIDHNGSPTTDLPAARKK